MLWSKILVSVIDMRTLGSFKKIGWTGTRVGMVGVRPA